MILRKATEQDLIQAAGNLSKGDLQEFHMNIPNRDPREVLPKALDETTHAIVIGSMVLAVGGSKFPDIWFVTTTVVDTLSRAERFRFYRMLKEHLTVVQHANQRMLTNYVSLQNKPHIRLLESLNARFSESTVMSQAGFAFRQFWL